MNRCRIATSVLFAIAILPALAAIGQAENWPQWRGPTRDGVSAEKNLPTTWSTTKNVAWAVPLPGMGSSTPAIWGERIFVTSEDGDDVAVLCFNTAGKQLWETKLGTAAGKKRFMRGEGNQASPSPCTDGKHVYAFFGTGDFVCCDLDGKIVWRFDAQQRYGKFQIQHGIHVSPVLDGDRLYLSLLHSGGWWVLALDKSNGKEVWKVRRESDATAECEQSYASPVLWRNSKDEYLVVLGCDYCTAHSLKDGSEIWRLGDINPQSPKQKYDRAYRIIATPAAAADLIVVPSARNGPVIGIKPEAKGTIKTGDTFERWRAVGKGPGPLSKTPDVPAPLIHDGLVYIVREYQREPGALICMDAKTGQEVYYESIHKSRYRASPVAGDGKIYLTARDGTVSVVRAGRKFELLATNKIPDEITASPAIANGRIYLRSFKTLYAISEGGK
jgi:outer membrane protein assembly factor BamB